MSKHCERKVGFQLLALKSTVFHKVHVTIFLMWEWMFIKAEGDLRAMFATNRDNQNRSGSEILDMPI